MLEEKKILYKLYNLDCFKVSGLFRFCIKYILCFLGLFVVKCMCNIKFLFNF